MPEFESTTATIPASGEVPRHVAIIMDGNGRWAKQRYLPRVGGHRRGVEAVRETVKACAVLGVEYLTLFSFSSENWRRPAEEVSFLMQLFLRSLEQEVGKLHDNCIRFKVAGDLSPFDASINELIRRDAIQHLKHLLKNGDIGEDHEKRAQDEVQKMTDKATADIDRLVAEKEKDLMAV